MTTEIQHWLQHDQSPKFYKQYPALFAAYFPKVPQKAIDSLSEAAYYYYHAMLILDEVIDDKQIRDVPIMLSLYGECMRVLSSVFDSHSIFWRSWERRNREVQRLQSFNLLLQQETEVSFDRFAELAELKSNAALLAIDGLRVLNPEPDEQILEQLFCSHKHFYTGLQLYDDVKDFRNDQENPQFNWAVHQYTSAKLGKQEFDLEKHNKWFYLSGLGDKVLALAQKEFRLALECLPGEVCSKWADLCNEMFQTIGGYRVHLKVYLESLEARQTQFQQSVVEIVLPNPAMKLDEVGTKAWNFLKECSQTAWADLPHYMWLSRKDGFDSGDQIHRGEVFQRSLLLDCLSFAFDLNDKQWQDFLRQEWKTLVEWKREDGVSGWSYFPEVAEIAPDIDDLAQVMIFLIRSGMQVNIDLHCKSSIDLITTQREQETGVWETWIVPVRSRTSEEQKQEWMNTQFWGRGPDVEVVANFAYALYLWDLDKYQESLDGSLEYLIRQQHHQGYWKSRWYFGHFYGTYKCIKFLFAGGRSVQHPEIKKVRSYLLGSQNTDGGFGLEKGIKSDALSTAFGILILRFFGQLEQKAIDKAKNYLVLSQNGNGCWPAVPFIQPKLSVVYKSSVMTTAWVLKALYDPFQ